MLHQSHSDSTDLHTADNSLYLASPNNMQESSQNQKPKTPATIARKFLERKPRPSLYHVCNLLKQMIFTNEVSLRRLSSLATVKNLPTIPVGQWLSLRFNLAPGHLLRYTERVKIPKHPLMLYLTRVDIMDENGEPDPRLRLVRILGQLLYVSAGKHPYRCESGFYLVVNVVDSSLWMMFQFNQHIHKCVAGAFGKNHPWGGFVSSNPFSAAKVANSISESGIGQADSKISFQPEDMILGGPGKVRILRPDDELLNDLLPKDDLGLDGKERVTKYPN